MSRTEASPLPATARSAAISSNTSGGNAGSRPCRVMSSRAACRRSYCRSGAVIVVSRKHHGDWPVVHAIIEIGAGNRLAIHVYRDLLGRPYVQSARLHVLDVR